MVWRWIVRLGLVVLVWDVTVICHGMLVGGELPGWLTTATVFTGFVFLAPWRPIVFGPKRAGELWRERPSWWPWSVALGVSAPVLVIAAGRLAHLPTAADELGVAAVSAFIVSVSLPVFEARYRAGIPDGPAGPAIVPRHVRRARERAARRSNSSR